MLQSIVTKTKPLHAIRRGIGMKNTIQAFSSKTARESNGSLHTATTQSPNIKPLTGIRVLELGQVILNTYLRMQ